MLLKLNIEAGNASNTGTPPASSSARILEQLKSVSQSSSAIHGINMILATCWNNNFKHRRVSTAALQNFRNFPARSMTQDPPPKHEQQHFQPCLALMDYLSRMFPQYNNYILIYRIEQSGLQPFVFQYPASIVTIVYQDTSIASDTSNLPITDLLFDQRSIFCWWWTLESQHILRVCATVTVIIGSIS